MGFKDLDGKNEGTRNCRKLIILDRKKEGFDLLGAVEGQLGALSGLADDRDFIGVALDDFVSLSLSVLCVSK